MAKSLEQQFRDWVGKQPADEPYDYVSNCGCALAQFLIAAGYPLHHERGVSPIGWTDADEVHHLISSKLADALSYVSWRLPNEGRTFGALAERLAKVSA